MYPMSKETLEEFFEARKLRIFNGEVNECEKVFINTLVFQRELKQKRIEKLNALYLQNPNNFYNIIDLIIKKYSADTYNEKEHKCGYYPRKQLLWILNDYFEVYGKIASEEVWIEYGNSFTTSIIIFHDYISIIDCGQGSEIYLYKLG